MLRTAITASRNVAAAAGISLLALAGCSSGSTNTSANAPSATSLIAAMKSAFATAQSVRIVGTLHHQGKTVALNLGMLRSGDMSGTIDLNSIHATLVVAGGKAYELVTKDFFKIIQQHTHVPNSVCSLMCGKYIAVPIGSLASFNLAGMTSQVDKNLPTPAGAHVTATTFHGQPAYQLIGRDGTRIYLARNGVHYPLGMVAPSNFGVVTFSDWNAVPPVTQPPASRVFNPGNTG
jgi:hypothetical protein